MARGTRHGRRHASERPVAHDQVPAPRPRRHDTPEDARRCREVMAPILEEIAGWIERSGGILQFPEERTAGGHVWVPWPEPGAGHYRIDFIDRDSQPARLEIVPEFDGYDRLWISCTDTTSTEQKRRIPATDPIPVGEVVSWLSLAVTPFLDPLPLGTVPQPKRPSAAYAGLG